MKAKKIISILTAIALLASFTACSKPSDAEKKDTTTVKVGVVGESNEMWEPVIEKLAKEGIDIKLVSFTDYGTPNKALNNGDTDLNAFQHYAYLNGEIKNNGYEIQSIGDTFISAMNIYSNKVKSVDDIGEKAKIAVPNDATNEGRALKIVEAAGLIELNKEAGDAPELSDIVSNPLNLEFVEVDAANVYAVLPDVTAAVINCNYALDNGLNPGEDSIFQDDVSYYAGKSYVNLIAARIKDADNEIFKKIVAEYQSEAVEGIYNTTFKGAYKPAWK
ncbi:MetQ/NlpA family ABC transporter substrate-binding protein [Sedimentibacter hydroxybenzoicus DSM 7310]|uniref:Lipoprotein n=1 Tax=Sedimentibacter hydroxybenzoicus DSM 7310 TaxID=1123245 RepID=A0A974GVS7_SEDHY|nr:MetQ/NlpA family ABC transporter substrate-binding protein [Sedimentibacter hydroxybenzoicus]NYB73689.1 MetQ/NlpA family ABC transporter substrate-binding protein [Sedimentibacter hydroxybenzoicus DSM 7310]